MKKKDRQALKFFIESRRSLAERILAGHRESVENLEWEIECWGKLLEKYDDR